MRANLRYIDLASAHDGTIIRCKCLAIALAIMSMAGYAVMATECGHNTNATISELDRAHRNRRYARNIMCNSNRSLLLKYIVSNKRIRLNAEG